MSNIFKRARPSFLSPDSPPSTLKPYNIGGKLREQHVRLSLQSTNMPAYKLVKDFANREFNVERSVDLSQISRDLRDLLQFHGWRKICDLGVNYFNEQLVREMYAIFKAKGDDTTVDGYYNVTLRGITFEFSPNTINQFLELPEAPGGRTFWSIWDSMTPTARKVMFLTAHNKFGPNSHTREGRFRIDEHLTDVLTFAEILGYNILATPHVNKLHMFSASATMHFFDRVHLDVGALIFDRFLKNATKAVPSSRLCFPLLIQGMLTHFKVPNFPKEKMSPKSKLIIVQKVSLKAREEEAQDTFHRQAESREQVRTEARADAPVNVTNEMLMEKLNQIHLYQGVDRYNSQVRAEAAKNWCNDLRMGNIGLHEFLGALNGNPEVIPQNFVQYQPLPYALPLWADAVPSFASGFGMGSSGFGTSQGFDSGAAGASGSGEGSGQPHAFGKAPMTQDEDYDFEDFA